MSKKKYDKQLSIWMDNELLSILEEQKIKDFFFPYQKNVSKQDIIRAMIQYAYNSISIPS